LCSEALAEEYCPIFAKTSEKAPYFAKASKGDGSAKIRVLDKLEARNPKIRNKSKIQILKL
jgi:hypothetical protein